MSKVESSEFKVQSEEHSLECVQSHDILYVALSGHPLHFASARVEETGPRERAKWRGERWTEANKGYVLWCVRASARRACRNCARSLRFRVRPATRGYDATRRVASLE